MTKHTPGPLFVELRDKSDLHGNQYAIQNDFSQSRETNLEWNDRYVHFSGYFGAYGPHVFAAAPDLLEALQNLIEASESMKGTYTFVQGETPEHDNEYGHEKWAEEFLQETTDAARAAIAKATGEQS